MAAPKYLAWLSGRRSEVTALQTSAGAGDADKIVATGPGGTLDPSLMPPGIVPDQFAGTSNGAITIRDLCSVDLTTGLISRASAAAGGKQCDGWAQSSVATGQPITIQLEGKLTGLSGLTPGARYFLSDSTPGSYMIAPGPVTTTAGKLAQYIGTAMSATVLNFEPEDSTVLAA